MIYFVALIALSVIAKIQAHSYYDSIPRGVNKIDPNCQIIKNFLGVGLSPTSLNVSWDKLDIACDVKYYRLTWASDLSDPDSAQSEGDQYKITDLVPCTSYSLTVTPVFDDFSGNLSFEQASTLVDVPRQPDCIVYSTTENGVTINVQNKGPCLIDYVTVTGSGSTLWPPDNPYDPNLVIEDINITMTKYITVTDLMPFSSYNVDIFPVNKAGVGKKCTITAETKEDVPGKPRNITISSITGTSMHLVWQAPEMQNGVIDLYDVTYKHESKPPQSVATEDTYITVKELEPCSSYKFHIRAHTVNYGADSDPVSSRTTADGNDQPYNLKCNYNNSIGITATWKFNSSSCEGIASEFSVSWTSDVLWSGDSQNGQETVSTPEFTLGKDVTTPYTRYTICVGDDHICCKATTQQEAPGSSPSMEDIVPNSRGFTAHIITPDQLNGNLQNYKIYQNGTFLKTIETSHVSVYSFSSCTDEEVQITATTGGGEGPLSEVYYVTTLAAAPTNPKCTPQSTDTVSVSWEESSEDCFDDTYTITWEGLVLWDVEEPEIPQHSEDVNMTAVLFDHITAYTLLSFRVRSDPEDLLTFASMVNCTTFEGLPTEVKDVESEGPDDDDRVRITWAPPDTIPGNLLGYNVGCISDDNEKVFEQSVQVTEVTISDLKSGHDYTCDIAAMTGAGSGHSVSITFPIDSNPTLMIVLIVVGVVVGVLLIGGGSFYMWKRKRSKQQPQQYEEHGSSNDIITSTDL